MIFGYPLLVWPGMAQCLAVHVPRCNVAATDSQEDVGFLQVHLEIVLKKECNVCIDWFFVAYFVCFLETLEWWSDGVGWCGMCHVLACLQDTFHSPFTSFFVWLGGTILPEHCSYLKDTGKSWPQQPRKAELGLAGHPKHLQWWALVVSWYNFEVCGASARLPAVQVPWSTTIIHV